ncbi:hypothetical protein [Helicobacter marmotae]|nr:hypothetical protein [Helicobacter marmotae]
MACYISIELSKIAKMHPLCIISPDELNYLSAGFTHYKDMRPIN